MKRIDFAFVAAACVTLGPAQADVTLVRDGRPAATLVVAAEDQSAAFAAGQLRYWTKEITGAELTVVSVSDDRAIEQSNDRTPSRVFIGRALAEKTFAEDAAWLGESQGFAIREKDGDLYVFGGMGVGALFGCYDLIEKATDIIWPCMEDGIDRVFTPRIHFMHHAQLSLDECEWASWKSFGVHNVSAFTECALEGL